MLYCAVPFKKNGLSLSLLTTPYNKEQISESSMILKMLSF